jgi:hypothetical protein
MHTHSRWLSALSVTAALCALYGCNHGCCGPEQAPPTVAPVVSVPAPAPTPVETKPSLVTGKWSGTWKSNGGHSGTLACKVTDAGPMKWDAVFTAQFGITMSYPVKLEGKPGKDSVLFGGTVDLGPAGAFTWSADANGAEFNGKYEGGGDTGGFNLKRVNP